MKRNVLLLAVTLAIGACPDACGDEEELQPVDTLTADTVPTDLGAIAPEIPAEISDSALDAEPEPPPRQSTTRRSAPAIPAAPPALAAAVEREQEFTRYCYQERGLKVDPGLTGAVAMTVTVGAQGVSGARVANSRWSAASAGRAVEQCILERATTAWRLAPGEVSPGQYVVQLTFRGG